MQALARASLLPSTTAGTCCASQNRQPAQYHRTDSSSSQIGSGTKRRVLAGLAGAAVLYVSGPQKGHASGLESVQLPDIRPPQAVAEALQRNKAKAQEANDTFYNSDFVKTLRDKSDANRAGNRKALQDKYCFRQAEMGVGDCAGLQLIPGMTKSGKQKTPGWLAKLLGQGQEEK